MMKSRIEHERIFENSRRNLLSVVIFSALNIAFTLMDAGISFLFSATLPMLILMLGQMFSIQTGVPAFTIMGLVFAAVTILLYLLCYLLSKKYKAFILVALVLFSLDTLFLVWTLTLGFDVSTFIDIAFHVWVLYYLSIGTKAWSDLKKAPVDETIANIDYFK